MSSNIYSQNGEDGIIDFLISHLSTQNKYVIEIGAADGIQNNSSWLVVVHQYRGLMIDGNPVLVQRAKQTIQSYSIGAEYVGMIVDRKSGNRIKDICPYSDPDVLSIDIDGIDYYVLIIRRYFVLLHSLIQKSKCQKKLNLL